MHDYDIEITEEDGALTLLPAAADGLIEVEVSGPQGVPGIIKVSHGSNPNLARPNAPIVYWVGTVQPVNALPDDLLLLKEI